MAKIEVDLVTHTDPPRVHAHSLVGKLCNDAGNCVVTVGPKDMTAQFNNLGIVHVTKKSQTEILKEKMKQQMLRNQLRKTLTEMEEKMIDQEVKELKKVTDLSIVRLRFTAYLPDSNGAFTLRLKPVISDPIHDSKSPGASNLRISRMDKTAGSVKGGDEVYLLCDKVQKDDIEVRFYEDDENGWQAFGDFSPTDVHKQYAIVFRTPPYHKLKIDRPVTVFLQLKRKRGGDVSDSKQFTYYPLEQDKEEVERKRRKEIPTFSPFFDGGAGGASGSFGQGGGNNINYLYQGGTGFYTSLNSGGVYHSGGHMMKNSLLTHGTEKVDEVSASGSSSETSPSHQREAQYNDVIQQVKDSNLRMFSLTRRMSRALLDYAGTSDPRMLLAAQRHLIAIQDENGDTPLHLAIIHAKSSVIHELLQIILSIPNQQIVNMSNHLHQTPLHLCVITQQYTIVDALMKTGADPTILDRYGNSLLHLAVQAGDDTMLKLLLNYSSVSHTNLLESPDYHGLFPVHWAVKRKNEKCLELLVANGANVNAAERKSGRSPLHIAVEMDNLNIATLLVKKLKADVNFKTFAGNTPLHLAASLGSPVLTRMLINAGANVLLENDEPVAVYPCGSNGTYSDSDIRMDTDSDHQGDSDSDTNVSMDSDDDHTCKQTETRTQCAVKRRHVGHTPLDLTRSEKVREILSKHGSMKPKGPEPENVLCLENNIVQRLEKLLNEGHAGADWTELATRLSLHSFVDTYQNSSSPTECLLRSYELAGGKLKKLITTLESMGLNEGVKLLRKSETLTKKKDSSTLSDAKVDSAYESQSGEMECSAGPPKSILPRSMNMPPEQTPSNEPAIRQ
ncbi:nuclear factor NF-kappa-B p100 subunit isoform X2 [Spea bombifrons]|nr:nuclear factor NF-kappa-B p100 subunit isoform X2 [Spea bombifrons]